MTLTPTTEQTRVLDHANDGSHVTVVARAGAGKTTTLMMLADTLPGTGLYTAFNKAIVEESAKKFPSTVASHTLHWIAYHSMESMKHPLFRKLQYQPGHREKIFVTIDRIKQTGLFTFPELKVLNVRRKEILPVKEGRQFSIIMKAITQYCASVDDRIRWHHFNLNGYFYDDEGEKEIIRALLPLAQKTWEDITDPYSRIIPITLTHVTKVWADTHPTIFPDRNYVLLDEAQDSDALFTSVLARQDHLQKIIVGDDYQNLYNWRGSLNLMTGQAPWENVVTPLITSWRFGGASADYADKILTSKLLQADHGVIGNESIDTAIVENREFHEDMLPRLVCQRTNAGGLETIRHILDTAPNATVDCRLAASGYETLAEDFLKLENYQRVTGGPLKDFSSIHELITYIEETGDMELQQLWTLYKECDYNASAMRRIVAVLNRHDRNPQVTISTVHRLKGLEAARVDIGDDFYMPLYESGDIFAGLRGEQRGPIDVGMTYYVAATRAKQELYIPPQVRHQWDETLLQLDASESLRSRAISSEIRLKTIADSITQGKSHNT